MTISIVRPLLLFTLLTGIFTLSACSEDSGTNPPDNNGIDVPTAYSFDSRFESGISSVSYTGQTVRDLLIEDITTLIEQLGSPGAAAITMDDLLRLYEYKDSDNLTTLTSTGALPPLEDQYSSISTGKNLVGKISDAQIISTGKTADELLREWFLIIATNSKNPEKLGTPAVYTDDEGHDLSEMVNKLLLGSVAYYQGTGIYLQDLLNRDNSSAESETEPFTDMEHAWDEAFGYFGAARDYSRFSDEQLAGSTEDYTFDANGDGKIDFRSEYNFGFARNAGKRDKGGSGVDFTADIFTAFLTGRTEITNQGTVNAITAQRTAVANGWEKVIAATVVHYINEVLEDMGTLTETSGPDNSPSLNKHWGEMKGFSYALQYNPFKLISDTDLTQLHMLTGDAPIYASTEIQRYSEKLNQAKTVLKNTYGFSEANMTGW